MDIIGKGHSTLASAFCAPAFQEVARFLNSTLRSDPDPRLTFGKIAKSNAPEEVRVQGCEHEHRS
jgi:hypothetical protein